MARLSMQARSRCAHPGLGHTLSLCYSGRSRGAGSTKKGMATRATVSSAPQRPVTNVSKWPNAGKYPCRNSTLPVIDRSPALVEPKWTVSVATSIPSH
jgi:hypothetical protein